VFVVMASQRRCRFLIAGRLVVRNLISNESIQPAAKSETCRRLLVLCGKGKLILPLLHFTLTTHPAVCM
jgi:hypothetical protein